MVERVAVRNPADDMSVSYVWDEGGGPSALQWPDGSPVEWPDGQPLLWNED